MKNEKQPKTEENEVLPVKELSLFERWEMDIDQETKL
ncbi:MAG: hypothetical protein HW421_2725 [Ignavibacteria bacterium]|nr:hypothetical protein [Ignavibacteria bacterium]